MPKFKSLIAVSEARDDNTYIADITADIDDDGSIEQLSYGVVPGDTFGIAVQVREAVDAWIAAGKHVEPYVEVITTGLVNIERDKRTNGGFVFEDVEFQSDLQSRENIAGAYSMAQTAIGSGAEEGNYKWHGGSDDFFWIATDNSHVLMDAQTMLRFGHAALAHKSDHIRAASVLKTADPIPLDYLDDKYWP